ncbi:MAG: hypothetical protein RLZZ383_282, partial [Pseudomonadota bacterium]
MTPRWRVAAVWLAIASTVALIAWPWTLSDAWGRPLGPRWVAAGASTIATATIATTVAATLGLGVAAASRRWPVVLRLADAGLWVPPLVVQLAIVASAAAGADRTPWLRAA